MALPKDIAMIGVDCGATKVLAHSAIYNSESGFVSPGEFHLEINYANHPNWNPDFHPVHLDLQRHEISEGMINLTEPEMDQSDVIVETIKSVISQFSIDNTHNEISENSRPLFSSPLLQGRKNKEFRNFGLCFPGIKNENGIVIMANGPRIPDLYSRLPEIDIAYHDSDCCVLGEWKSTIGNLQQCENAIYIGGGTGIADGIILKGELIDFNERDDVKRSWELMMPSGESVEYCLSPKGMIDQWNQSHVENISTLSELNEKNDANIIFEKSGDAISFLIQDRIQFFKSNNTEIEKIVLGQRLGEFLSKISVKLKFIFETKSPIEMIYSSDRRMAALGAAWQKICS